jgi:hypothetical protein
MLGTATGAGTSPAADASEQPIHPAPTGHIGKERLVVTQLDLYGCGDVRRVRV